MGYRYSLASVTVTISYGTTTVAEIGGNKSMLGSITLNRSNDRFSAEGDATGGFIVNETLDATGEVVISIRQLAPLVATLTSIFTKYDSEGGYTINSTNQGALNITVKYMGQLVGSAKGCYLNMPELPFEEDAGNRDFTFVAGEVTYEALTYTSI